MENMVRSARTSKTETLAQNHDNQTNPPNCPKPKKSQQLDSAGFFEWLQLAFYSERFARIGY